MSDIKTYTLGALHLHDVEPATLCNDEGGEIANCLNGFGNQKANASQIMYRWNGFERLVKAASSLVKQIEIGTFFDELGHDAKNLKALADLKLELEDAADTLSRPIP